MFQWGSEFYLKLCFDVWEACGKHDQIILCTKQGSKKTGREKALICNVLGCCFSGSMVIERKGFLKR